MARTLIQGRWIVGYQHGHHAILRDGVVVYEDDRILYVGEHFAGAVDAIIAAPGKLVTPGFVNLHALASLDPQTLVLDASEDGLATSEAGAPGSAEPLELDSEQRRAGVRSALLELIKGGSTTIVETTPMPPSSFAGAADEVPALVDVAAELGARIYVSHKFRAGIRYRTAGDGWRRHWDHPAADAALHQAQETVRRYEGTHGDRVRTLLSPDGFDGCTLELLKSAKAAARELNVPIRLPIAQSLFEFHESLHRYGQTPVQLLERIGFLDERTILAHLIYTTFHPASGFPLEDTSDLRRVAAHGSTVAHCPVLDARRGRILHSFARYGQAGINVGLGTAAFPQEMVEEMRWAALGCKWADRSAESATAREVFNAVTLGGAQALGRNDIGRLAPGAKADILIIDLHNLHSGPVDDPIKTLVYAAAGSDVETVIIDGRTVLSGGKGAGVDEPALCRAAADTLQQQQAAFVARHPDGKPGAELFPASYPVVHGNPVVSGKPMVYGKP